MKIDTLILENDRGFRSLRVDLPQHCLLVGRNGSGKSTIVEAVTISLDHLMQHSLGEGWPQWWLLFDGDIHGAEKELSIELATDAGRIQTKHERGSDYRARRRGTVEFAISLSLSIPIFVSYRADRQFDAFRLVLRPAVFPQKDFPRVSEAWWMGLGAGPGTFDHVIPWFRREENAENETRLRRDPAYRHPSLEVVRAALTSFLNGLGTGAFSNPRISRVDAGGDPLSAATDGELAFDKDGQPLTINQLSDGERVTLLMVMDIARRMAIANPQSKHPLQGNGVVLIDEVELHLHPAWQRAVLPALFATFPNVQFIATTHSPQVLASVPSECVRILEDFQVHRVGHTEGRDSNALLREIFDVPERPQGALDQLEKASRLIDAGDLAAAKAALAALQATLTDQDGEVLRLQSLLAFLEA